MKKYVIVDIDGTIATPGDRLKYLQQTPKDWDSFYKDCFDDAPIVGTCDLVRHLETRYNIVYCTGRRGSCRNNTRLWLIKNNLPMGYHLLMRQNRDHRHDTIVKPELLLSAGIRPESIAFVLEDRNSMVARWRELGITCYQVAEGDF